MGESASAAAASPKPSRGQEAAPRTERIPLQGGSAGPAQPGPEATYRQASQRSLALGPWSKDRPGRSARLGGSGSHTPRRVLGQPLGPYLEVQDDRPYEPEGQLGVAVSNVIIPDVHQLHLRASSPQLHPQASRGGAVAGRAASPGGVGGSPGRSERSAACGNASSPSPGAAGRGVAGQRRGARRSPRLPSDRPAVAAPRVFPSGPAALPLPHPTPPSWRREATGPQARPRLWEGRKGREETIARKPRVEGRGTQGGVLPAGGGSRGVPGPAPRAMQQAGHEAAGCTAISPPSAGQARQATAPGELRSQPWGAYALP